MTFSSAEKSEIWRRWKNGENLRAIGRALSRSGRGVARYVRRHGGLAPPQRVRSARHLSLEERESISRGLAQGHSLRAIARTLARSPSTISREVVRNAGLLRYRAAAADERAWDCAQRPKQCHLAKHRNLQDIVTAKLEEDWSPEQIASYLRKSAAPAGLRPEMYVSHETIYKSVYVQARNALKHELCSHLRRGRNARRSRTSTAKGQRRGCIENAVSIHQRPACVEDRNNAGHWEGDLVAGTRRSQIATLVERHSRFLLLVKLKGRDANSVAGALIREAKKLPKELMRSLTWDRGLEMARHARFTNATGAQVYFCDPQSPWQRGSNENTNGLLRQYFPKGKDLTKLTQADLNRVATRLNNRPRKMLDWQTPAERLSLAVALMG